MKNTAIVLAGGNGSRMKSDIPKQFLKIEGRTVLYYSLKRFEDCPFIDEIVLVSRKEDIDICRNEYKMSKISAVVPGGSERYESVIKGLECIKGEGYVYIHDGARPCISSDSLNRLHQDVCSYRAAVLAVRSKDTVRISDDNGNAVMTPARNNVWLIQTPQAFEVSLIKEAYKGLLDKGTSKTVTDDAMVVEEFTGCPVHLTEGEYTNIKITTSEDIGTVSGFLKRSIT